MKSLTNKQPLSNEHFYKICIIGGGMTGAIMALLLKKSTLFDTKDIAWIVPKIKKQNDLRTTFYNQESIKLLNKLNVWNDLKKNDYTNVKKIKAFGKKGSSPLVWDNSDNNDHFGAVIKNDIMLTSICKKLNDIKKFEAFVTNTTCNDFERTLYLNNKESIKTNLILAADGKNSKMRELLSIKTIKKKTGHVAISGFLEQSRCHNFTAIQAFTDLGPIGLLPFGSKNKINFVLSIEENKYKYILSKNNFEQYLCQKLENFFSISNLNFKIIKKVNNINSNISCWPLDLNFIMDPTANRAILIGDAAHSLHPLAGQGLNLAMRDCVSVINSIEKSLIFGNDLGDGAILKSYKKHRLSKTITMTAITDFLFYGFTSNSKIAQTMLSKGMETLNKSNLKNIFRNLAAK
ncbi:FAD-dependent monooxygenase [Alphaproteobacteria bacterium]|nr:FAD-dependent monooxygenase [Alphaproteobacteria bacterium]MDC1023177.1 FAD-dependent monooxygenase [Alphaproteobacteria bacterium]